jgi:HNH endonuclease.
MRSCCDCGASIEARGNRAKRCVQCSKEATRKSHRAANRRYAAAHPERILAKERALYRKNPGKSSAKGVAWRAKNPARQRQLRRNWTEANREKQRESVRRWFASHPEAATAVRRAMKHNRRGAPGKLSAADAAAMLSVPCAYCGAPSQHVEHCTPLSRGGWNDIGNCVGACARCNLSKNAKTVLEFTGLWPTG